MEKKLTLIEKKELSKKYKIKDNSIERIKRMIFEFNRAFISGV